MALQFYFLQPTKPECCLYMKATAMLKSWKAFLFKDEAYKWWPRWVAACALAACYVDSPLVPPSSYICCEISPNLSFPGEVTNTTFQYFSIILLWKQLANNWCEFASVLWKQRSLLLHWKSSLSQSRLCPKRNKYIFFLVSSSPCKLVISNDLETRLLEDKWKQEMYQCSGFFTQSLLILSAT